MNFISRAPSVFLAVVLIVTLTSCAEWETFHSGTFDGKRYQLEYREVRTPTSNRIEWRFKYADLPALPINAQSTDWGPPYSDDIYGSDAYQYLPGEDIHYVNTSGKEPFERSMLYLSPTRISETDYETYSQCILAEWGRINELLKAKEQSTIPSIIGIVYGNPDYYTKTFRGLHEGKGKLLKIENDGRVRLMADDKAQSETYSGLSKTVHMPGKILYLNTTHSNGGLTMQELKNFKNEQGADPTAFFQISDEQ